ncbi:guanine nucleotide-binding protein-like 3 homolog [Anneissia japonica]|uniref:guanine nucleotide-binding protein-like 3 homolog n=1 Tax=Anneissia japonica TaxID=1529436 RepID=UPI0014254F5B|nr:guanine nucleotide-binding protein-like 3 homolog [Anneissia japonica]
MVKKGRARKLKSKRMTCKMKYKIAKKVKEHDKKVKRKSKKEPHRKPKKDIGIPNLAPFKETILREAEQRKVRAEELKQRQKEQRHKDLLKKRKLEHLTKDAERKQKEYAKKMLLIGESDTGRDTRKEIDSTRRAYYREFKKVLNSADVILQVLDARDPLSSRCTELEQAVLASGLDKKLVLVLNKIDLVPKDNAEKWLKHLRNEFPTVAFKASTQTQKHNLGRNKTPVNLVSKDLLQSSQCLGAESLIKLLANYCRNAGIKTSITVGVVGFPNVGKSSLINSLKRARTCNVGAMPGVTKSMQEVHLDKNIKLLDSPGVVLASGNDDTAMALRNCVKIETLDDPIIPVEAILRRCNKNQLIMHYSVPDFSDVHEFLSFLATKQGKLKKGGVPDVDKAAVGVLIDWNSGKITYYTHPPEQHTLPTHITAEIVTELGKAFDIAAIENEQKKILQGTHAKPSSAILFESTGPTKGVINDEDDLKSVEEEMEDSDSDDDEEEEELMEDSDEEVVKKDKLSGVTVNMSSKRGKQKLAPVMAPVAKLPAYVFSNPNENVDVGNDDHNLQSNKRQKKSYKKMLKQRRRADALASSLSDNLTAAFGMLGGDDDNDNYDFKTDFK